MILDHRGNPYPETLEAVGGMGPLYEAGSTSARLGYWGLSGTGPNGGISGVTAVRKRSRHLCRNNPIAGSGVDSFVSNLVGVAITPEWQIENKE